LKSITKLFLSVSISSNVFFRIARKIQKFPLISIHSFVALNKVAKLLLLHVHNSLRNKAGTEGSLEVRPGDECSNRL
jgi:hypothetical protein